MTLLHFQLQHRATSTHYELFDTLTETSAQRRKLPLKTGGVS